MLRDWLRRFQLFLRDLGQRFLPAAPPPPAQVVASPAKPLRPLERIVLTDSVCRTMFDDFAAHRRTNRGDEEIGWVLLGVREDSDALALATLPAGTQRSAGVAHVRFHSVAQAVASMILRQREKRLVMLGVVHTHPGSLRRPSEGDFQGDSRWVGQLPSGEGVFGIGTADVRQPASGFMTQTGEVHQQILGDLCFSWYALAKGDRRYRPLPIHLQLGPDLAKPLHPLWNVMEENAGGLERLGRQQAGATFQVIQQTTGPALNLKLPLAEPGLAVQVVMDAREICYYLQQGEELSYVDPEEERVDRAVYLILADLARDLVRQPTLATKNRAR